MPDPERRLAFIDGLRGLAALWVLLFHLSKGRHLSNLMPLLPDGLKVAVFDAGYLGVPVFFVLSGFVMVITARQVAFDGPASLRFVAKRLLRLTPPYYFAIGISALSALYKAQVMGLEEELPGLGDVVVHLAYAQGFMEIPQKINIVFWTLSIEVQFYCFFALHCWLAGRMKSPSRQEPAMLAVMSASAVAALAWPIGLVSTSLWVGGFMDFWNIFAAGALAGCALYDKRVIGLVYLYAFLLACGGLYRFNSFTLAAASTAFILALAIRLDSIEKWLSWRWLQNLALCSYSLYLLHGPVTGVSARLLRKLAPTELSGDVLTLFFSPLFCIAFSYAIYKIIERPSIDWSRRISLPGSQVARRQTG